MARRSSLLASDADRERVADRLRQASTEGRILAHELEERVARALRARTYGELDELVSDLPGTDSPTRRGPRGLTFARSHPLTAVAVLVIVTLMLFVTAAVIALSGVWLVFLIALVARLGGGGRPGRSRRNGGNGGRPNGGRQYGGGPYGGRRGRYPYWVR